jgi:predicted metal-dependent hydrolase
LKLTGSTQLSLWGDEPFDAPALATVSPSPRFDPLTAVVSPLAAPPQSTSSTQTSPHADPRVRGLGVPLPDDEPLPDDTARVGGQPRYECHPASGLPWFRHPQAEREIRLGKAIVSYEIKRARRRSIGMVVGVEGLSVRAPRWVSPVDIETALRAKERWICNKLVEQRERAHKQQSAQIDWREGATVPYLGESVVLVLDPRVSGAVLQEPGVSQGAPSLPGVAQRTVHAWLQREAMAAFMPRVAHFAQQLSVNVAKVRLSSAKTRWGSASVDGSIRLHWRLIHFSAYIIDYVVAHELAHLREMNHSPRFWDTVRSVMPEFDGARDQLRHAVIPD